jgi:hypothetical protein
MKKYIFVNPADLMDDEVKELVGAPPYIRDVIWRGEKQGKPPRVGGKGITKRPLAMFKWTKDYEVWFKIQFGPKPPYERWREMAITAMFYEMYDTPEPDWLVYYEEYNPIRHRTLEEETEDYINDDDSLSVEKEEDPTEKKKKPSKMDILEKEYKIRLKDLGLI